MALSIPDGSRLGTVTLAVADLSRSVDFYNGLLGLDLVARDGGGAVLGTHAGGRLLELVEKPGAHRVEGMAGLYHVAYLVPSRASLGRVLNRLRQSGLRLDGAADHAVSEALYLHDPDGHGIEIYRDRGREAFRGPDGRSPLVNEPLDFAGIAAESGGQAAGLAPDTLIGHVHLQTHDLAASARFYGATLGLDTTADWPGRAAFFAWGRYHHHLAVNSFHRPTRPLRRDADVIGILSYEIVLPDAARLAGLADGLGRPVGAKASIELEDPSGIPLRLKAA